MYQCSRSPPPPHHYCYHSHNRQNTVWKGEQRQSLLKSVWQHDYSVCILDKNSAAVVCCSTTADNSQTQESWPPVKQLFNTHLPACFPIRKNCLCRGEKKSPHGKPCCKGGVLKHWLGGSLQWLNCVRNSHFFPATVSSLPSSWFCRRTYCLKRNDSCERI